MKNKLEIGMYVRTEYGIAKVIGVVIKNELYKLDKPIMIDNMDGYEDHCTRSDIIGEPSFDIIDLIKPGDLVNDIFIESNEGNKLHTLEEDYEASSLGYVRYIDIFPNEIETVITHEQLDDMTYEVK